MTQYNTLNLKLDTEVTLEISSNDVGDCNDENIFTHELLLINTQVSKLRKAFENGSSATIKFSKTQLHNKGIRILLCVIDIYSKYAWVIPLKVKNGITITNDFQKTLKESNRKRNKILADKGNKYYNRSMKSWSEKNAMKMYSAPTEGKSVVAERFTRALKIKFINT